MATDETANPLQIETVDQESRASEDTAGSLLEAAQGRPLRLPQRAGDVDRQTTRAPYWFWLLGLLNNASYVIMIASAKSIDAGGVAVVYLVAIGPGLAESDGAVLVRSRSIREAPLTAALSYGRRLPPRRF